MPPLSNTVRTERLARALQARVAARRRLLEAGVNWIGLAAVQLGPDHGDLVIAAELVDPT